VKGPQIKTAAASATAARLPKLIDLDQVDLSRQIRGNLEADFLLANRGLHPGLHGASPLLEAGYRSRPFMMLKLQARAAAGQLHFP
jgi:hypothetical protein